MIIKTIKTFNYKYLRHLNKKKETAAIIKTGQVQDGEKISVENIENDGQIKEELKEDEVTNNNFAKSKYPESEVISVRNSSIPEFASPNSLPIYHNLSNNSQRSFMNSAKLFNNRIYPKNSDRALKPFVVYSENQSSIIKHHNKNSMSVNLDNQINKPEHNPVDHSSLPSSNNAERNLNKYKDQSIVNNTRFPILSQTIDNPLWRH